MNEFFSDEAKRQVTAAVREVEAQSTAELVVTVRHAAGRYRHVDYLVGALCAFAALLVLLFHPHSFAITTMPIDVAVAFVLGAACSSYSPTVRRVMSSPAQRKQDVTRAARAAFVELGVSRTHDRTGVLVYVAALERAVEVVCDIGVDVAKLDSRWSQAIASFGNALQPTPRLDSFVVALCALGPPLGAALPRAVDDVNELPDEMVGE